MKNLKVLCLILCFAMLFSSFVACKPNSEQNEEGDETFSKDENTETGGKGDFEWTLNKTPEPSEDETSKIVLPAVLITDAVNYTCGIISNYGWEDSFSCEFYIPKLNYETENSKAFNDKIYKEFSSTYEFFKNYKENTGSNFHVPDDLMYDSIYSVDYTFKIHDNIVGIVVRENRIGVGTDGMGSGKTKGFYYDCNNDKELSFEEYLGVFEYTKEDARKLLVTMKDKNWGNHKYIQSNSVLEMCLIDSNSTLVYFSNLNIHAFDDMGFTPGEDTLWSYEVDSIIVTKKPKQLSAEETAIYWEKYYNENKGDILSVANDCIEKYAKENHEPNYVSYMTNDIGAFVMDYDNDKIPELCILTKNEVGYIFAEHTVVILKLVYESVECIGMFLPEASEPPYNDYWNNIYIDSSGNACFAFEYSGYKDYGFSVTLNEKVIKGLDVSSEWFDDGTEEGEIKYTVSSSEFDTVVSIGDKEYDKITAPHWEWLENLGKSFIDFKNVGFFDVWNKQCELRK